jgi:hypothetical protein
MFGVRYKGLRVIPSRTAARELTRHGFMLEDCKEILERGYSPRKRRSGTVERWLDYGRDTYNVVVVRPLNYASGEEVYLITHFGRFTKKQLEVKK